MLVIFFDYNGKIAKKCLLAIKSVRMALKPYS